jgi:hypothetical protein
MKITGNAGGKCVEMDEGSPQGAASIRKKSAGVNP